MRQANCEFIRNALNARYEITRRKHENKAHTRSLRLDCISTIFIHVCIAIWRVLFALQEGGRGGWNHDSWFDVWSEDSIVDWSDPDPVNLYGSGSETGLDLDMKMSTIYAQKWSESSLVTDVYIFLSLKRHIKIFSIKKFFTGSIFSVGSGAGSGSVMTWNVGFWSG